MPDASTDPLHATSDGGIHVIDLGFLGQPGAIAAFLVEAPEGLALVETGPTTTIDALEAGVAAAGHDLADIGTMIVTHIHLDHAGAAGSLLARTPRARVFVHPVGAPHLVDPSRLVTSAGRIYGDDMKRLWGEIVPVPEDRVVPVDDGARIDIGGRLLTAHYTPGHASHHLALLDADSGALFSGDVAGVRLPGTDLPVPPMPPPDIDVAAWHRSIALMRSLAPSRLLLTHFGAYDDVATHLNRLDENIGALMALGRQVLVPGGTDDDLTAAMRAWQDERLGGAAVRLEPVMEAANPLFMGAMGIRRVLRKAGDLDQ